MIHTNTTHSFKIFNLLTVFLLSGCAADYHFPGNSSSTSNPLAGQQATESALAGARFSFYYSDYYTLTSPNSSSCAGDANAFYDPVALTNTSLPGGYLNSSNGPLKLATDLSDSSTTIRPAFIKNVSVDVSDANSPLSSNLASACSFGDGSSSPGPSSCSTFDYGAIGGIPSGLGGTLLLFGGMTNINYDGLNTYENSSYTAYNMSNGLTVGCGPIASSSVLSSSSTVGYNNCSNGVYALGINTLPASAAGSALAPNLAAGSTASQISSWASISSSNSSSSPNGLAGATASFNQALNQILIFGGASPMTALSTSGAGTTTYDTWTFSLESQSWTLNSTSTIVDSSIQIAPDLYSNGNLTTVAPSAASVSTPYILEIPYKGDGGRSLFGMVAAPGMGISQLGSTGKIGTVAGGNSPVDTTDRIVTVGGYCNGTSYSCQDTHIMNPTYAPEYIDAASPEYPYLPTATQSRANFPAQWIDSSYTRILSNSIQYSQYDPTYCSTNTTGFPVANPAPTPSYNEQPAGCGAAGMIADTSVSFGMVALSNNHAASLGVGATAAGVPGAGYLLVAGGFHGNRSTAGSNNVPSGVAPCTSPIACGNMEFLTKWFYETAATTKWDPATENYASNFTSVANINESSQYQPEGIQNTPAQWIRIPEGSAATEYTPWYGAAVMLKGITNSTNDVVYFGGTDCQNFMLEPTTCTYWKAGGTYNPGAYWSFGTDPAATLLGAVATTPFPSTSATSNHPAGSTVGGTTNLTTPNLPPINGGMAAARGADSSGNPIIVAWGGMTAPTVPDNTGNIFYLYKNSTTGNPTWAYATVSSGASPQGLTNASLVYSHVTGKFYLFGGYNGKTLTTSGDTWQLSVSSSGSTACGVAASGTCTFTWTQLNSNAGLTCYPSTCPPARRSHRMVEANYNYFNAPSEPSCTSPTKPCSFGLFMEGGTPDGINILSDRWMFDPTANGGAGHWQAMGDLPPRTLAASANIDYVIPTTGATVHRVLLFGGETGMQTPYQGQSGQYFVPPTLGDTWLYDYASTSWNRVKLYGERFSATPAGLTNIDERASSLTTNSGTNTMSPPPTSGGVMVTRTLSNSTHLATNPASSLAIPEVFFFGGRTKDGKFTSLGTTYKFCAGTTGEKNIAFNQSGATAMTSNTSPPTPDDASCDAFNSTSNPDSPNPIAGYVGTWLVKSPSVDTYSATAFSSSPSFGSFMGAGTYDPVHDLIILYGGLTPDVAPANVTSIAVTDSSTLNSSLGALDPRGTIYEYTPPSALTDGNSAHSNGLWTAIPTCLEEPSDDYPSGRYGHTMAYDTLHQNLIVVGGYDLNGNLLTTTDPNTGATIPEIWNATRIDNAQPNGIPSRGIPAITSVLPCYYWSPITVFGNTSASEPGSGLAHASGVFIPPSGYNSGFYTTDDTACQGAGPISSSNPSVSRLLAGGAYIDIDRTQLGQNENLILNLTFLPLGTQNLAPNQSYLTNDQTAVFKIHLVQTGQTGSTLRSEAQPRYLTYASTAQYPEIVQDLAFLSPPTGQIRQEQVYIPLSASPNIDRIRIERYSGNAILIEATVFRLGHN